MKSFISLFAAAAAAALTFVSVEASHAMKGQHAGTNAQRFARGLPPKPMVKSDVRMRRGECHFSRYRPAVIKPS
jgi:hypothetical protein